MKKGSVLVEEATLGELEWVVDQQMEYYNKRRRHSGVGYKLPSVEYLSRQGIDPTVIAEKDPTSEGCMVGRSSHV